MINILIKRNQENEIMAYAVSGHAETAPHGEDIVCAAVSVLTQTTILSMIHILGQQPVYSMNEGKLSCQVSVDLNADERREATILLESMLLGLKNIQQQYPAIIVIVDEEV